MSPRAPRFLRVLRNSSAASGSRFSACFWVLAPGIPLTAQEVIQEFIGGTFGANLSYSVGIASEREIGGNRVDWSPTGPRFAFTFEVLPNLDLEVSGAWLLSGRISSLDLIAGGHYNIDTGTPFTPYIGLGGGVSWILYSNEAPLTIAFQGAGGAFVYTSGTSLASSSATA